MSNSTKVTVENSPEKPSMDTEASSKLTAFFLKPATQLLLWIVITVSMFAVVLVSGKDRIKAGGACPAIAATFYAATPLYTVWRLGSDAVRGFKAADTGAKVGRVLALVLMGTAGLIHAATIARLAALPLRDYVIREDIFIITAIGAGVGLCSILVLLAWEAAARTARKAWCATAYVGVSIFMALLAVRYLVNIMFLVDKDAYVLTNVSQQG